MMKVVTFFAKNRDTNDRLNTNMVKGGQVGRTEDKQDRRDRKEKREK